MSVNPTEAELQQLKIFVDLCMSNPMILHRPELAFVKSFIEHFGGHVPDTKPGTSPDATNKAESQTSQPKPEATVEPEEPESEESDLELDMSGVIEPDENPCQELGDPTLEPTEEQIVESQEKRSEAVSAFAEKDYEKAIKLYTEAIVLNPQASLLYAKRGQIYLLLNKPNACIRDCDRALTLNPDSAAAHKFRGRAYHLLGKFEEAANDLRLACKLDFDEQADEWLREVTPNARKIEEHKRKKERRAEEKLMKEKQERIKKVREAREAAAQAQREDGTPTASQTSESGPVPGMGDFYQFLNDPDVLQAFQDPEVAEAFKNISSNPSNIFKYQSNPKIMALITKLASKFGGNMGNLSDMMGGIPNFPGAGARAGATPPNPPKPHDDVGLD